MSLQDNASMTTFANACSTLWTNWANPPLAWPGGDRRSKRRNRIDQTIITNVAAGLMPKPAVVFEDSGTSNGSFSWTPWRLRLRRTLTANSALAYAEFVKFCRTMYHELRHAEQFYRVAQGLLAGSLQYPDKSESEVAQELNALAGGVGAVGGGGGGGGVGALVARFNTVSTGGQLTLTAQLVSQWLSIPLNVAQHAYNNRGQFAGYIGGAKPDWFRRKTIKKEVEEWMRATYKGTLSGLNAWTQSDEGKYDMYRDQPEEHDAHEIGNKIVAAIDAATGVASGVPNY
jgi:hypothetical protein